MARLPDRGLRAQAGMLLTIGRAVKLLGHQLLGGVFHKDCFFVDGVLAHAGALLGQAHCQGAVVTGQMFERYPLAAVGIRQQDQDDAKVPS